MRSAVLTRRRQYELRDQLAARQKAEAHAQMLAEEMKHRIKNSLAMVGALASQTFRDAGPMREALGVFSARLEAMALAQQDIACALKAKCVRRGCCSEPPYSQELITHAPRCREV